VLSSLPALNVVDPGLWLFHESSPKLFNRINQPRQNVPTVLRLCALFKNFLTFAGAFNNHYFILRGKMLKVQLPSFLHLNSKRKERERERERERE